MREMIKVEKNIDYKSCVERHTKRSSTVKNGIRAFLGGGTLCLVGEILSYIYIYMGLSESDAYLSVTLTFIFIGATLTALGVFDTLTNHIFAGALVPVTGFSNSVTSAAMDAADDGHTVGIGAKIFTVSGPVILFASLAGVLYGFVYYLTTLVLNSI